MVHLPFADRLEAGRLLAADPSLRKHAEGAVILALTRGGVPVGFAVADRLHLPLDIIVVRKIGVPWQPELAMGAIAGTTRILDDRMIQELGIADEDVETIVAREHAEMKRREDLYRGGKPAPDLKGRSAILIDDGLATGSTMLAAVRHARSLKPAKVIIGVPVGSADACDRQKRATPSQKTMMWSFDIRRTRWITPTVPISRRSDGFGLSWLGSFWAMIPNRCPSPRARTSSTLSGRPMVRGKAAPGNSVPSRTGRIGTSSIFEEGFVRSGSMSTAAMSFLSCATLP